MELKLRSVFGVSLSLSSLNRTFYGIETIVFRLLLVFIFGLNRTFYGIETILPQGRLRYGHGLNRTFYGIETQMNILRLNGYCFVLIVPFMELKQGERRVS